MRALGDPREGWGPTHQGSHPVPVALVGECSMPVDAVVRRHFRMTVTGLLGGLSRECDMNCASRRTETTGDERRWRSPSRCPANPSATAGTLESGKSLVLKRIRLKAVTKRS